MNMKKIVYLLSVMLLSVVNTAMAQYAKVNEGYYKLVNITEGCTYTMYEDAEGHLMYKTNEETTPSDLECIWYVYKSENGAYSIQNQKTGRYISSSTWDTAGEYDFPSFKTENSVKPIFLSEGYQNDNGVQRYVLQTEELVNSEGSLCAMHGSIHNEPKGYLQSWWYLIPVIEPDVYYIRNIDANAYLNAGNEWGTQASILDKGLAVVINQLDNGKYTIKTGLVPGGNTKDGYVYGYLTGCGWMDGGNDLAAYPGGIEFTLSYDEKNRLTITPDGTNYLGYDGITSVVSTSSTIYDSGIYWELISDKDYLADIAAKAEYAANYAKLAAAKAWAPVDATFLIKNANFDEKGSWEGNPTIDKGICEVWNRTFDVSQRVANVPNGYYRLTFQGFHRHNTTAENTNANDENGTLESWVMFGDYGTPINPISWDRAKIAELGLPASESGLPFSMDEAKAAFDAGLYVNTIVTEIRNGEFTLRLFQNEMEGCDWTVFDNFQLKYYGPEMLDITGLIKNPNFDEEGGWEGEPNISESNGEKWNCTFEVSQKIGHLPKGYYILSCQGFYRYNNTTENSNDVAKSEYEAEVDHVEASVSLLSNGGGVGFTLPSIASEIDNIAKYGINVTGNGMPFSQSEAKACFDAGLYYTKAFLDDYGEGEFSISIRKGEQDGCDWTVFDNFHLYYLGDTYIDVPGQSTGGEEGGDDGYTNIASYENVIYVDNAEVNKGTEAVLSVKMNNTIGVRGFQCDLVLPEGVTIVKEDDIIAADLSTERTTATKMNYFDSAIQADGSLRILCSSTKANTFDGNSGEVCTVKVNIPEGMDIGDYKVVMKNIIYTDVNASRYTVDGEITTKMTVLDFIAGDANGDKTVDVSDAAEVANYILGNPSAGFNSKAADINGDGNIDVSDFAGLANIILYGTTNSSARVRVMKMIK